MTKKNYESDIKMIENNLENSSLYTHNTHNSANSLECLMCCERGDSVPRIILECNHVFHISCLVDTHCKDVYNFALIDEEFFETLVCTVCNVSISYEQLRYIHSQNISSTNKRIVNYSMDMEKLNFRLKALKEEIRACTDYKHKLEQGREKSKQIVAIIATII